ncbi:AmmeMemoRadiSam system radical SAM enzyme [Bacteroidota bacterium]
MKEAAFYKTLSGDKVQCVLCPHNCIIPKGKSGICKMRKNFDGKLYSENYGLISSKAFDPIEKKPLYNFHPGKTIFSIGSIGCNLKCQFCQNHQISQCFIDEFSYLPEWSPEEVIKSAKKRSDNIGIAYTYDEPTVWYEFMRDTAILAHENSLLNVMVSNGFINAEPLIELMDVIDAFSIDLKAFTDSFYKRLTSSDLKPVLESLKIIHAHKKHLEIVNLVIPGENDDEQDFIKMIKWISENLGKETVLHLSKYYPTYKLSNPSTSIDLLERFYNIANEYLDYVYLGNVRGSMGQHTFCPECNDLVIERDGYTTKVVGLGDDGKCLSCKKELKIKD